MNDLLNKLSFWLVKQLDKLKMSNPFLYTLVQGVLVLLILGISSNLIQIPTPEWCLPFLHEIGLESNKFLLIGLLSALSGGIGLHTSKRLNK